MPTVDRSDVTVRPVAAPVPARVTPRRIGRGGFGAVWHARELLWSFVRRDLAVRYRHAVLGVGWALLSPLCQAAIFTVIFTRIVRADTGVPYPLFAFCGLAAWGFTASALRGAVTSLSGNSALVTRVAFRREVLPLAAVLVAAVDFSVALTAVALLCWFFSVPWHPVALLLPAIFAVQLAFTVGLALLLATANLFWRDVRHVFDVCITLWMFATSVLYPMPSIDGALGTVLAFNPMSPIVDAYRAVLLRGTLPATVPLLASAVCALVVLRVGLFVFQQAEPHFAEVA